MKIYAAAFTTFKLDGTELSIITKAFGVPANSEAEATGLALGFSKHEYPPEDGWHSHQVHLHPLPKQWLLDNLAAGETAV